MKKHIINGHEMATLRVPKARYTFSTLWYGVQPYVNFQVSSDSVRGRCWAIRNGKTIIDTEIYGGHPLQNSQGQKVHYVGQQFLLIVPVFCLSEKGLAAAKEYEERQQ